MNDLFAFAERVDVPVLPHAALFHAQFETIHPFIERNGRTGRARVHGMLRRAGVTERVTVPLSAGLLTDTVSYFSSLDAFRRGEAVPIIKSFTQATVIAIENGRRLVDDLVDVSALFPEMNVAQSDSVI